MADEVARLRAKLAEADRVQKAEADRLAAERHALEQATAKRAHDARAVQVRALTAATYSIERPAYMTAAHE